MDESNYIRVDEIQKALAAHSSASNAESRKVTFDSLRSVSGSLPQGAEFKSYLELTDIAWSVASPLLGIAVSFLSSCAMDAMGMHQTTLTDLANAIAQVKALQTQTIELRKDMQTDIQSLDAIKAENRLESILKDMKKLTDYEDAEAYNEERERIIAQVAAHALADLWSIHSALIGNQSGLGLNRDGILHHVYNKLNDKLHNDKDFTMQQMAKLLDAHFLTALFLQWHYFNLWTSVSFTKKDKCKVELKHFLANLQAQSKKFKDLQPAALDYFVRTPDAVGNSMTYNLRHHDNPNLTLCIVDLRKFSEEGYYTFYTKDEGDAAWASDQKLGFLRSYDSISNRIWIRDRDNAMAPQKQTLEEVTGPGGIGIKLPAALEYYGCGFVHLSQEGAKGWPRWVVLLRERQVYMTTNETKDTLKLVAMVGTGNDVGKNIVQFWDTKQDRRIVFSSNEKNLEVVRVNIL